MQEEKEIKILGFKFAQYWHAEMLIAIPFGIWFVIRLEMICYYLSVIAHASQH